MNGSIVFACFRHATFRQRAPPFPNRHLNRTGAAPCWITLSISTAGHVRACPGPALFALKLPLHVLGSWPPSYKWFLGLNRVHIPNGTPFLYAGAPTGGRKRRICVYKMWIRRQLSCIFLRKKLFVVMAKCL